MILLGWMLFNLILICFIPALILNALLGPLLREILKKDKNADTFWHFMVFCMIVFFIGGAILGDRTGINVFKLLVWEFSEVFPD